MGNIYRKAFIVTVRLDQSPRAMDCADELANIVEAHLALDLLEELRLIDRMILGGELAIYKTFASQRRSPRWFALMKLLRHPWFDRILGGSRSSISSLCPHSLRKRRNTPAKFH